MNVYYHNAATYSRRIRISTDSPYFKTAFLMGMDGCY